MKNSILSLGKTLNKNQQKLINGGLTKCYTTRDCDPNYTCIIIDEYIGGHCQHNDYPIMY